MLSNPIQTADLEWQCIDGIDIPVSKQFGDVYFSKDNGLLETRHVFLNGNDLPTRLAKLQEHEYFCVGETGFGTGLNILALWQLWQQVRPDNHSRLHAISVEKFPLKKQDLIRALNAWPELQPLAEQLIAQYPMAIAGCHRLQFADERFSLDLWLGDAHDVFPCMVKNHQVNAWFLDGFAPSCNPDMWEENVLKHIVRLSDYGTSFASFSVAGVLKRGLKQYGVDISRPRGFGHKREMLKAIWNAPLTSALSSEKKNLNPIKHVAVVGAGIAGLSVAWACARRGYRVDLFDRSHPLSGASGNPLALLNPKLCPISQSSEHLMTLAWQHALRHYAQFDAFRAIEVQQFKLKPQDPLLDLAEQYPEGVLKAQDHDSTELSSPLSSLLLHEAGAVSPHQLRDQILAHPHIYNKQAHVTSIKEHDRIELFNDKDHLGDFEAVVVCAARESAQLLEQFPTLKPIRGQVSWTQNQQQPLSLNRAYSYGGYCMQLDHQQLILGASFYPNRDDDEVLLEDHQHNYQLLAQIAPAYASSLPPIEMWQGRASVRAQSADYFPVLGKMANSQNIYSFAGLGSKGFLFAPLCSEILAAQMFKEACPVPESLKQKLDLQRFIKKSKVKKPYFKPTPN